ncbi:MAG: CPBP family intramembrane metalloprotease [Alphaproteobacteria bacterium]|nr:MAG: CPBP family intramembrane metalloprotease [Alphaproteobacteria bacterium]
MSETGQDGFRSNFDQPAVLGGAVVLIILAICATFSNAYSNVAVLGSFLLMLVFTTLRRDGFRKLGYRGQENWWRLIGITVVLAVLFETLLSGGIEPLVSQYLGETIDLSNFDSLEGNILNTGIMLALGWIVGGFLEEMLFRGFILQGIERLLGGSFAATVIAIAGSSVLFGLPHFYQDTVGMIMTGLMGLVFGVIYVWSGRNLWFTILLHGFVDTYGIILIYLGKYDDLRHILFG